MILKIIIISILFNKNKVRHLINIIFILFFPSLLFASRPVIAVVGVNSIGLGTISVTKQIDNHLADIIESARIFSLVNTAMLNEQLSKYGCVEERCILSFALTAGIDVVISGNIDHGTASALLNLTAYGMKAPYFGRAIYRYTVKIPVSGLNRASDQIMEEHAGRFISRMLSEYRSMFVLKKSGEENLTLDSDYIATGIFQVYRFDIKSQGDDSIKTYSTVGKIKIKNNNIIFDESDTKEIKDGDFIFFTYKDRAEFLSEFYEGRKKEIVFESTSYKDDFLLFISTPPASALMPVVAPLAYYKYGDYSGLALWALNSWPYIYVEYQGLIHRPETYRDDRKDIPVKSTVNYRFGLYMLACGGMSLVADSFSKTELYLASNFQPRPNIGNTFSAVYLSLVSGGGGHFYRGYRLSGYIYFHLNNILIYSVIKEFSPSEKYNPETKSYNKDSVDKKKAYSYLGAFCLLKAVEITHVILRKDRITNGEIIENNFSFEPEVIIDNNDHLLFGAKFVCRI
jgi:hypothetical protein